MEYLFSLLLPHSLLFLTACLPSPLSLSLCCKVSSLLPSLQSAEPSHHLTSPLIFPSFSSPHLSVLPLLTPFSPHLLLDLSSFGHSSSICLKWACSVSSLCRLSFLLTVPFIPPSSGGPHLFLLLLCSLVLCSIIQYLSFCLSIYHPSTLSSKFNNFFTPPFISSSSSSLLSPAISLSI